MIIDKPVPFQEAVDIMGAQGILPTSMSARQLETLDSAITERAFFSARVSDAGTLSTAHDLITGIVSPAGLGPGEYMDQARFREVMRGYLDDIGYSPTPGKEGGIQDLRTERRLNLIADVNTQQVQGFGQYLQGQDPDVLDAFPCQELFRLESRKEERDWPARWAAAGGKFYGAGRMIARKDDPIWPRLSRWGNAYPPYDYNSGMWVKPVSRGEAVRLGVIAQDDQVKRQARNFNDGVQSSGKAIAPPLQKRLLKNMEGRGRIDNGVLSMLTAQEALASLVDDALNGTTQRAVNFGPLPSKAVAAADTAGVDLKDYHMLADGDAVRSSLRGRPSAAPDGPLVNLTADDIEALPETMLAFDALTPGQNTVEVASGDYTLLYELVPGAKRMKLVSMWKKAAT